MSYPNIFGKDTNFIIMTPKYKEYFIIKNYDDPSNFIKGKLEREQNLLVDKFFALQNIHNQTEQKCIDIVKLDYEELKYVHEQTENICVSAVKHNGAAIKYVSPDFLTFDLCMMAMDNNIFWERNLMNVVVHYDMHNHKRFEFIKNTAMKNKFMNYYNNFRFTMTKSAKN